MAKIKEGTKVRITELGFDWYGECDSNPKGITGVVEYSDAYDGFIYHVNWDNGHSNSYEEGTLAEVVTSLENV